VTDFMLSLEWYDQDYVWWASILICIISLSNFLTFLTRLTRYRMCSISEFVIALMCLFGLGPTTMVPWVIYNKIKGDEIDVVDTYVGMVWYKLVAVAIESGPSFILTCYITAIALFTDRDAPKVVPITWISLIFNAVSISQVVSKYGQLITPMNISVFVKALVMALCFLDTYFSAMAPPLLIAIMDLPSGLLMSCFCLLSIVMRVAENWYYGMVKEMTQYAVEKHNIFTTYVGALCWCCISIFLTSLYETLLIRIIRFSAYLSIPIAVFFMDVDYREFQSKVLVWTCMIAGSWAFAIDMVLTVLGKRHWSWDVVKESRELRVLNFFLAEDGS